MFTPPNLIFRNPATQQLQNPGRCPRCGVLSRPHLQQGLCKFSILVPLPCPVTASFGERSNRAIMPVPRKRGIPLVSHRFHRRLSAQISRFPASHGQDSRNSCTGWCKSKHETCMYDNGHIQKRTNSGAASWMSLLQHSQ